MFWNVETGLAEQTVDTLPTPAARLGCNAPVSGNDGGHDCNPRWLARRGAILLGRLESVDGSTLRSAGGVAAQLAVGDEFEAAFRRMVDEVVAAKGLDVPGPEPEEERAAVPEMRDLDLRARGVGAVIWANGFRPDHSWIEGIETDAQGWPVQRRGVSSLSGLYFVGLHWLHKRKSALLIGVGEDAEHVASSIASNSAANV
jgi:putative flavoprotein involved in K+ transport